jgi:hypothetical protein
LDIPTIQQIDDNLFEEISDINGIAIPYMYYDHFYKENGIKYSESKIYTVVGREIIQQKLYGFKRKNLEETDDEKEKDLETQFKTLPRKCSHTCEILLLANMLIALQEHFTFKFNQIKKDKYTWLTPSTLRQCYKIMNEAFGFSATTAAAPPVLSMEETIIINKNDEAHAKIDNFLREHNIPLFRMTARVDLITEDTIWELKCTRDISVEHLLQVVVYAWIWRFALEREPREFKILNIKTGEIRHLNATNDQLSQIMLELFRHKCKRGRRTCVNDALFDAGAAETPI